MFPAMGVDHRVDSLAGGHAPPPLFSSRGDVMCLVPLLFKETNIYYVLDLLNNDCFSIIMHSKTHLICLAAGLRPDPHRLGGRTYSTRETPSH